MHEYTTEYQNMNVTVNYSGSGSDLTIESIVDNDTCNDVDLPDFASAESVALHTEVMNHDYEANQERLEEVSKGNDR